MIVSSGQTHCQSPEQEESPSAPEGKGVPVPGLMEISSCFLLPMLHEYTRTRALISR